MGFLKPNATFEYDEGWKTFSEELATSFQAFLDGPDGYMATASESPTKVLDYFFRKNLKNHLTADLADPDTAKKIKEFMSVFQVAQQNVEEYIQALYHINSNLYNSGKVLDACSGLGLSAAMLAHTLEDSHVTALDPINIIAEKMVTIPNLTGIADTMSNQKQLFKDTDIAIANAPCDGMEEFLLRSLDNKKPFFAVACDCREEIYKLRHLNSLNRMTKLLHIPVRDLKEKTTRHKLAITNLRIQENNGVSLIQDGNNARMSEGYEVKRK